MELPEGYQVITTVFYPNRKSAFTGHTVEYLYSVQICNEDSTDCPVGEGDTVEQATQNAISKIGVGDDPVSKIVQQLREKYGFGKKTDASVPAVVPKFVPTPPKAEIKKSADEDFGILNKFFKKPST